jgi:hypothetical protein
MLKLLAAILLAAVLVCIPAVSAPQSQANTPKAKSAGSPNVKVWVNTKSRVYHCPGTSSYGKTQKGAYMTQKEAQAKKYRPANGKVCR